MPLSQIGTYSHT
ncbi:hypothetical protein F383_37976 [Gossypium arboreum]|uniref:Uncharacterized protein n=1 Tax=Gossypium arboreum TaxID=29729 RepID=A0A0B0MJ61_GOSAR|nr:hypothetical protein F383_37976 [Gossypium arboreum]